MTTIRPFFSEQSAVNALNSTKILSQWHRLVGTDGEKQAREWISAEFEKTGITFDREEFVTSDYAINVVFRVISPLLGFSLVFAFLVSIFRMLNGWLGVFAAAGVVLFALAQSAIMDRCFGKGENAPFGKRFSTENIIGRIDAREAKATVIFLCHYDSKSQTYPSYVRVLLFLLGATWTLVDAIRLLVNQIFSLFGAVLLGTFWDIAWWDIFIAFILNFSLIFNKVGNNSPGALDNAAAVGILLELARIYQRYPPQDLRLRFVATGSEELGLNGAAEYVRHHSTDLDRATTYFIVYDSPSMKRTAWLLTSFGVPKKVISQEISDILLKVGRDSNIPVKSLWLPIGAATDHLVITQAGYKAGVITGPSSQVHTSKDTVKFVTTEGLQRAGMLG